MFCFLRHLLGIQYLQLNIICLQQSMNGHLPRQHFTTTRNTPHSSSRIDQLFSQFQSLKTRIRSNSKSKHHQSPSPLSQFNLPQVDSLNLHFRSSLQEKGKDQFFQNYQTQKRTGNMYTSDFICNKDRREECKKQEQELTCFNEHQIIKSSVLEEFQSGIKRKIDSFQGKLGVCEEIVKGIATLVKMRKGARTVTQRPRKKSFLSHSPHKQKPVFQVIQEYEQKIANLTQQFETKIRQMKRQNSRNSDKCESTARSNLSSQNNEFQSLLLARDNQISLLKIEISKLRRSNDKLQVNFTSQLKIISQLQKQVENKQKNNDRELIDNLNLRIKDLEKQIELKNKEGQEMKQSTKNIQLFRAEQNSLGYECSISLEEGMTISQLEQCKSQIIQPRRLKKYENMRKLEVEIDLITEENKNLQIKKHFLQHQNKTSQQDEERFQLQSNLLKQQIKFLNSSLSILDEAAVSLIKGNKLKRQRVEQLGENIHSKKLFIEKIDKSVK